MGLVVDYGGPMLDKYYCVVTIGDDDPCRRHKIPHLWQLGAKKQYYSVIFSITAVTCNLDCRCVWSTLIKRVGCCWRDLACSLQSTVIAVVVASCNTTSGVIIATTMLSFRDCCSLLQCNVKFGWLLLYRCLLLAIWHKKCSRHRGIAIQHEKHARRCRFLRSTICISRWLVLTSLQYHMQIVAITPLWYNNMT